MFSGDVAVDDMNSAWWELRMRYSGVAPPVHRSEEDFDPGAKYHVPANTPYVRHAIYVEILQFFYHFVLVMRSSRVVASVSACCARGS